MARRDRQTPSVVAEVSWAWMPRSSNAHRSCFTLPVLHRIVTKRRGPWVVPRLVRRRGSLNLRSCSSHNRVCVCTSCPPLLDKLVSSSPHAQNDDPWRMRPDLLFMLLWAEYNSEVLHTT